MRNTMRWFWGVIIFLGAVALTLVAVGVITWQWLGTLGFLGAIARGMIKRKVEKKAKQIVDFNSNGAKPPTKPKFLFPKDRHNKWNK